jgi:hypothetical protein
LYFNFQEIFIQKFSFQALNKRRSLAFSQQQQQQQQQLRGKPALEVYRHFSYLYEILPLLLLCCCCYLHLKLISINFMFVSKFFSPYVDVRLDGSQNNKLNVHAQEFQMNRAAER